MSTPTLHAIDGRPGAILQSAPARDGPRRSRQYAISRQTKGTGLAASSEHSSDQQPIYPGELLHRRGVFCMYAWGRLMLRPHRH